MESLNLQFPPYQEDGTIMGNMLSQLAEGTHQLQNLDQKEQLRP